MGLLQLGFGEIARKFRRLALSRQIKAAARAHTNELRTLGKRAMEAGITGPASEALKAGLAETQAKEGQLGSRLSSLDAKTRELEAQRDADAARFKALEQDVVAKKAPLDAELSAQQKAAARSRQQGEEAQRRLAKAQLERQSLELKLGKAPGEGGADFDRPQAQARLAALSAEQQELEALQPRLAEAGALATREIDRLKAAIAPLQADLDRIGAERSEAAERVKRALAELRKESGQVRTEAAGVSRQRDRHLEELGAVLAAAGTASPALAAEMGAVAAASQAQAALQSRYDGSLADSSRMPKHTMAKFGALMLAATAALGAGGYAATQAFKSVPPAPAVADNCRMTYEKRKPVKADPGGPYSVVRAGQVMLDGRKSRGDCLTYTWTFAPAPKDASESRGRADAGSSEDEGLFAAVAQLACPEGQAGNPGARKKGPTANTTFLCSMQVTLTVTDGHSTDRKDVLVKVKARGPQGWQTSIDTVQPDALMAGVKLVRQQLEFGKNVCALDNSPDHALHAGASWQGEGYSVASVKDPGGPFDEWWYIGSSKLRIKRSAQINPDLAEGSALSKMNVAKGYPDFDVLRKSVREHERLHGTIIFEKMQAFQKQGHDPAKLIEPLSVRSAEKDRLVEWADIAIRQVESHLYPGQKSPEYIAIHQEIKSRLAKNPQFNRAGKVLIPDGAEGYGEYAIPNFATTGEDGGG